MRTRTKARQRAVESLFEAEQRDTTPLDVLSRNPEVNEYARVLIEHVQANSGRIDEVISTYLSDRTIERMPALDRAIARVSVAELLYEPEIESGVVISEAMELAELLSTEQSAKFLNGLLGSIAKIRGSISTL